MKLKTIVWDEGMRDPKLGNDVLPNKLFGIHIPYVSKEFNFNPFDEIICANQ